MEIGYMTEYQYIDIHTEIKINIFVIFPAPPFRLEITKCIYPNQFEPIIEATLDGVLYRSDNYKDSIIVKGSYGTR